MKYHGVQQFEQVSYTPKNNRQQPPITQPDHQPHTHMNNNKAEKKNQGRSRKTLLGWIFVLIVGNMFLFWGWYLPSMEQSDVYAAMIRGIQTESTKIQKIDPTYGKIIRPPKNIINPPKLPQPAPTILNLSTYQKASQYSNGIRDNFQFSRYLFQNWLKPNPILQPAQYYRYNKTYNLDHPLPQKRMCIMAPFRNLLKYGTNNGSFHIFLRSINEQNYSNYHVYMIDDASSDNSSEVILKELVKYPRLNNRITILRNQGQVGALGNRDSTTRHYCGAGDIVMDVDGDDALIGRQVFNFVNRLYYNNPNAWFIYTNFIQIKGDTEGDGRHISINVKNSKKGICSKIRPYVHQRNTYRTELHFWMTSQLRTYLWDLYVKVPLSYVIEKASGRYYFQASDRFTMYALVELAGIDHTLYVQQFNYFYFQPNFQAWKTETKTCTIKILFYCEAQARILTPLLPLKSLNDTAIVTPNYEIPDKITEYYLKAQFQLFQCLKRKWTVHSSEF